jgi:hypothetical protein
MYGDTRLSGFVMKPSPGWPINGHSLNMLDIVSPATPRCATRGETVQARGSFPLPRGFDK